VPMSNNTVALLTPPELAERLQIPLRTLGQWRYSGHGPRYVTVGRHVRYSPEDVEAWLDAQTRGPDAPAA